MNKNWIITSSDKIVSIMGQEKRVFSHSGNFTACKVGGITRKLS